MVETVAKHFSAKDDLLLVEVDAARFGEALRWEVSRGGEPGYRLLPAQHLHRLQDQWTTEVAIHSTWSSDLYTILHNGEGRDAVRLTLVENPLMRWMWLGGWVIIAGTLIRLWPARIQTKAGRQTPTHPIQQRDPRPRRKQRRELANART